MGQDLLDIQYRRSGFSTFTQNIDIQSLDSIIPKIDLEMSTNVCPGSSDHPEKISNIFSSEKEVYTDLLTITYDTLG